MWTTIQVSHARSPLRCALNGHTTFATAALIVLYDATTKYARPSILTFTSTTFFTSHCSSFIVERGNSFIWK